MFFSQGGKKGEVEVCGEKGRMERERYGSMHSNDFLLFTFESGGPNGRVKKEVRFQKMSGPLFNLVLVDIDETTGHTSDNAVTNNNDTKKILSTVAGTIFIFLKRYPEVSLFFKGSTHSRTRLFRRAITLNWKIISKGFVVYGQTHDGWEEFVFDEDYIAFLIQAK